MNVLVLGMATKRQYIEGILKYVNADTKLYTFESFYNESLNEAAEDLDFKLFIKGFYDQPDKIDEILFFSGEANITEVMVLTESLANKKPVIFIPV